MGSVDPRSTPFTATGRKLLKIVDLLVADSPYDYYITTSYRQNDNGSHHGGQLSYGGSPTAAIDIGFKYGSSGYQTRARWLASRLYAMSGDIVELIVSKVGTSNSNSGYYVKNQRRVGAYAHTGPTPSWRHEDHIHFATSSVLADRMIGKLRVAVPTLFEDLDLTA